MAQDDRKLLLRTQAGHEPSARELWSRHAGWMVSYARSVLGGRYDAEDVVQSVFCRILTTDRATLRGVRELRPWLASATRHEALNHIRTARRAAAREAATRGRPDHTGTAVAAGLQDEASRALASLPRRLREVVYLRHVLGLTVDQTATSLRLPRGTVASRNHSAMERLRDMLGARQGPPNLTSAAKSGDTPTRASGQLHAGAARHAYTP